MRLLDIIHDITGLKVGSRFLSSNDREKLRGANEKDIVYSGLEEIMCSAVKETRDTALKTKCSLRMACYSNAIMKIHNHFVTAGIPLAHWDENFFFLFNLTYKFLIYYSFF